MGEDGDILVRASGTEDLIRVYMCYKNQGALNGFNDLLSEALNKVGKKYER